jgi:glyoxylase-like metal-dependent hydrolase (beta-lactamase superfamily II)
VAQVFVLRPGYARQQPSGTLRAGGTISLVIGSVTVLVDTGTVVDRQLLLDALRRHDLNPVDIQYVVCTHGHSDHIGNNNLFAHATFIIGRDLSVRDEYTSIDYSSGSYRLDAEIDIIETPGHTSEDIAVLVRTAQGRVVIAGDVFENASDLDDDSWVALSRDPEQQRRSRSKILELADFIVPGHGDTFAVPGRTVSVC